jgi:hypothetical protein
LNKDLSQMPVQTYPCMTCPFEGKNPTAFTAKSYSRYVANIVNLKEQHLCHSTHNKTLCRGGRNLLLKVLCVNELIPEPTDAAFESALAEALNKKENNV